jgi:sterol 14-demethylase
MSSHSLYLDARLPSHSALKATTLSWVVNRLRSPQKTLTQYVRLFWSRKCLSQHKQHLTTPVFGKDVVYDVPNEVFMEQKKFVKVGLSTENFRAYMTMFEQEVDDFMRSDQAFIIWQMNDINEWGRFDVTDIMAQITILTASRTLQGKEVRSGLDKSFSALYNDLDGGFTPLNLMFPNLPLESYRRRDEAHKKMSEYYINIIRKRRESGHSVRCLH